MIQGLDALLKRIDGVSIDNMLRGATEEASDYLHSKVLANTPVDKGDLYRSITLSPIEYRGKTLRVTISTKGIKHAMWVEEGTGVYGPKHTSIVPLKSPLLVFFWKKTGRWMYMSSVKGQPGKWMFRDTFNQEQLNVLKIYHNRFSSLL